MNLVYSQRNRSASCRIPLGQRRARRPSGSSSAAPTRTSNPYLAFSAMLLAGLDGIAEPHRAARRRWTRTSTTSRPRSSPTSRRCPARSRRRSTRSRPTSDFLTAGGVFTDDLIETWVSYKRSHEVDALRLRPHPYEFTLYYDI